MASNQELYEIAMHQQAMKAKKKEMFKANPDSVVHSIKTIAYDRMLFELRCLQNKTKSLQTSTNNGVA
jgi:hypothetical protein